jgi:hypothetical protein
VTRYTDPEKLSDDSFAFGPDAILVHPDAGCHETPVLSVLDLGRDNGICEMGRTGPVVARG